MKCGNVVGLALLFSQSAQTEKARRALLETFTVIYALEK